MANYKNGKTTKNCIEKKITEEMFLKIVMQHCIGTCKEQNTTKDLENQETA